MRNKIMLREPLTHPASTIEFPIIKYNNNNNKYPAVTSGQHISINVSTVIDLACERRAINHKINLPCEGDSSTNRYPIIETDDKACNNNTSDLLVNFSDSTVFGSIRQSLPNRSAMLYAGPKSAPPGSNNEKITSKDPVEYVSVDEPDHLQYRFGHTSHYSPQYWPTGKYKSNSKPCFGDGCSSELSSALTSPSISTVSSPLSTPTRHSAADSIVLHSKINCYQNSSITISSRTEDKESTFHSAYIAKTPTVHHHQYHYPHNTHHHSLAAIAYKKQNVETRLSPSPYRQLLPIALCILSFATVFSILIIYMDTTEIRHQQFRLNMSRDYELFGVAQDDPTLIAFLRQIHMRKYPLHFKNLDGTQRLNFSAHLGEIASEMAHYVAELLSGKTNGAVIQSMPGRFGQLMIAPWLTDALDWAGIIVEPEPRRYFSLRKQNAHRTRMEVLHACVSSNPYPKEVTIHSEESDVQINSLLDEETSWFNSRVKCFPLYTIMLACNRFEYDLLSLGVYGHELEILQTLPFDKIKIQVISIHLLDDYEDAHDYLQTITEFLLGKSYKLQKRFGHNYFYQRDNAVKKTKKKDILLLKTP